MPESFLERSTRLTAEAEGQGNGGGRPCRPASLLEFGSLAHRASRSLELSPQGTGAGTGRAEACGLYWVDQASLPAERPPPRQRPARLGGGAGPLRGRGLRRPIGASQGSALPLRPPPLEGGLCSTRCRAPDVTGHRAREAGRGRKEFLRARSLSPFCSCAQGGLGPRSPFFFSCKWWRRPSSSGCFLFPPSR